MTKFMEEVRQTVIDYKEAAVEYAKPFSTVDIGEIYFLAGKFAGIAERLIAIDDASLLPNPMIVRGLLDQKSFDRGYQAAMYQIRKILEGGVDDTTKP